VDVKKLETPYWVCFPFFLGTIVPRKQELRMRSRPYPYLYQRPDGKGGQYYKCMAFDDMEHYKRWDFDMEQLRKRVEQDLLDCDGEMTSLLVRNKMVTWLEVASVFWRCWGDEFCPEDVRNTIHDLEQQLDYSST
jgi:hypothetical protein